MNGTGVYEGFGDACFRFLLMMLWLYLNSKVPGPGLVARPADSREVAVAGFHGFEFGLLRFFVLRVLLFRVLAVHADGLCVEHRHCGDVRGLVATVAVLHK